jgi:PAS domain S-box-containing protein
LATTSNNKPHRKLVGKEAEHPEIGNKDLRRAQENPEASWARYFDLYDLAPVGYCTISQEDLILETNLTTANLLNVARDSLVKKRLTRFILKADQGIYYRHRKALFETGTPQVCEIRMLRKNSPPFWTRLDAAVAKDSSSAPTYRLVLSDLTEQKKAEQKLKEAERKFRLMTEAIQDVFWISTPGVTEMVYISPGYERIWRKSVESLYKSPHSFLDAIHPDDLERFRDIVETFHAAGKAYEIEYRITPAPGVIRWIHERGFPITDDEAKVVLMTGTCADITDRKRIENEMATSKEFLEKTMEFSPLSMWISDAKGTLLRSNQALRETLNVTEKQIVGIYNALRDQNLVEQGVMPQVQAVFDKGTPARFSIPWEAKKGSETGFNGVKDLFIDVSMFPIKDNLGKVQYVVCQWVEITERIRTEQKIRSTLAEKEVLLREVHHRVKNNLQAMIYLIDHRLGQVQDQDSILILKSLREQARTIALVYEQLHQSVIFSVVNMNVYLPMVATNIVQAFSMDRHIEMKVECENVSLDIDQAMPCGLMVAELLTNAIKYAFPPDYSGDPQINVKLSEQENTCELIVSDNGIGLPENLDLKTIKSMGLRLVSLWATHQMGGTIDVKNDKEGLTYHFTFPKKRE